jgi:hypothetical protein
MGVRVLATAVAMRANPRTHHDALEFPDGRVMLLTDLFEGEEATVFQLPAQPATAPEVKPQARVLHAVTNFRP